MNKVLMMGRLTKDPEIRYSGEKAVARFSLAVDRRFKKDEVDFFNCVSFGKQAEFFEKYVKKGTKVVICGRLQQDSYTNKNGEKAYSINIIVDEVEFAESKKDEPKKQDTDFVEVPDGIEAELPFK